ncbi:hypothetical protein [Flavobacterium phycosphaerae]|uniref:hypothetical protein n=1 Tax=Flavobacterium phycosphaerae TaxID=2697515 RepID=UPI00138A0FB3|nr:hypothetical protein [Flavobacterium phycosphaerae]
MKKILFLSSLLLVLFSLNAQQVQWASKAIKFSSDLGGKQNGVKRILGRPDAFPQGGLSPNAWMPKDALKGYEWVEVGFENPQTVKQVAVFENLNAGCVVRIAVDNGSGKYQTVWSRKVNYKTPTFKAAIPADRKYYFKRKRRKIQEAPEVLNPGIENAILEEAVSGVVAVRVEFNFALLPGQKQIDAIGISDSEIPLEAKINTIPAFETLASAEVVSVGNLIPSCVVVSPNGQKLFFTDETNDKEIIYSCSKQNGQWSAPVAESDLLNTNNSYNFLAACQTDFFLKSGKSFAKGTGETGYEFLDKNYQPIGLLKIAAYANYDETSSVSMTADAKTLVMGIETDMTQGGHDLYFATKKEDGTYTYLQNLGKQVNSAGEEASPCLLSDQRTLLFSSDGFSSIGDNDIYVSYRLDDTWKKWSAPINLGSKVNSNDYDGNPFYDEKAEVLYFTSLIEGKQVIKAIAISKEKLLYKQ